MWRYRFSFEDRVFDDLAFSVSSSTFGLEAPEEVEKRYKEYREKEKHPNPKGFIDFLKQYGYHVKVHEIDYTIEWELEEDVCEND